MVNKTVEERVAKILDAFNQLSSIDLEDIIKKYKSNEIDVIADNLKYNYARYNVEDKLVVIDKQFTNINRNNDEMAYVLLHEYFHVFEKESAYLSKETNVEEDADVYASFVFENNGKEVPERFKF